MKAGEKYKCTKQVTYEGAFIDVVHYTLGVVYEVYELHGKPYILNDLNCKVFGIKEGHFELIETI